MKQKNVGEGDAPKPEEVEGDGGDALRGKAKELRILLDKFDQDKKQGDDQGVAKTKTVRVQRTIMRIVRHCGCGDHYCGIGPFTRTTEVPELVWEEIQVPV